MLTLMKPYRPDRKLVVLGIALLIGAASCAVTGHKKGGTPADPVGTKHSFQSPRLREIMNEIDRLSVTQWPQEIAPERSEDEAYHAAQAFWEAKQLAVALSDAARRIPEAVQHVPMTEVDRRSFQAQVQTLEDQGKRLRQAASIGDREGMRGALAAIDETCKSCHSRFRDISGELPNP